MRKNVSDATVCPYISPQCGIGRLQAVNGRHWVGIGMEGKRYLACGCGRGRMGTGADYLLNDIPFQESSSRMIDFYS